MLSNICECGCGSSCNDRFVRGHHRRTHGMAGSLTYRSWDMMKDRCLNPNATKYPRYGGAGITICDRWLKFENFIADMGERPSSKYTIDRINNNGNYEPDNCRWATAIEQANNKRNNRLVVYHGQRMTLEEARRASGTALGHNAIIMRMKRGWPVDKAIDTPSLPNTAKRIHRTYAGRRPKESSAASKLTEADVRAIRADGRSARAIANEYGVSSSLINRVISRRVWAHVTDLNLKAYVEREKARKS